MEHWAKSRMQSVQSGTTKVRWRSLSCGFLSWQWVLQEFKPSEKTDSACVNVNVIFSYRFSELTRYDWSHHARNGRKGVGDSQEDTGVPADTGTLSVKLQSLWCSSATASFKCQAWIYIKTRIHILRSTEYYVYSGQTGWIRSFSFLRGSDVQVVDVETGRRHAAQRRGDGEERHSQDVVTACVTSRHEKTRWPNHAYRSK